MTVIANIHHLLLNHCTRCEHDEARSYVQRQRYLDRVAHILTTSRLAQRTGEQIWHLGWDKPFFAYNTASAVGPVVERARAAGVFADREAVASPQFMIGKVPGPLVEDAVARPPRRRLCRALPACACTGIRPRRTAHLGGGEPLP